MALLFADSFDHYGTGATGRTNMLAGAWAEISVGGYTPGAGGRTGSNALRSSGSGNVARISMNGLKSVVGVAYGVWMAALPSTTSVIGVVLRSQANNSLLAVCVTPDGAIAVKTGNVFSGTIIAISDSVLTAGTFHHVEFKAVLDDTVGSIEVRVNGVVVLNSTDLNLGTIPAAAVVFDSPSTASGVSHAYDDFLIWDNVGDYCNDFLGPQRVLTYFPVGDTAQADWTITGGSGPGYDAINKAVPDGDTSFIGAANVGSKSDFTLPTLPPETAVIAGVFVPVMGRIDEAGVGNIKMSMISGANVVSGLDINLTPGYIYSRNSFEFDPTTNAPWTKAGFEAALVRIEKTL